MLGELYYLTNRDKQAIESLTKAIGLEPKNPYTHLNLALVYAMSSPRQTQAARLSYRKAIEFGAKPDPEIEQLLK